MNTIIRLVALSVVALFAALWSPLAVANSDFGDPWAAIAMPATAVAARTILRSIIALAVTVEMRMQVVMSFQLDWVAVCGSTIS